MTPANEFERLSVPVTLRSGLCATPTTITTTAPGIHSGLGPSPPPPSTTTTATTTPGTGNDTTNGGTGHSNLAALSRSASHRTSATSSTRRSVRSIRSHVSSFQNVRFDPEPIKDISFWGGVALLISNMTGPGLVTVPIIAQSAGWLPTILGFGLLAALSTLSSLFICEAMTEVPGNEFFQSNVEFSNLILCFFGRRYHLMVQIICFLAMQTTNIASIAVSAQLFDNLLIKIFHRTCGIQLYPHAGFVCVTEQLSAASPFSGVMIMSTGVLLAFSMILPLGLLKLSENIWVQLVSFVLILFIVCQWIVTFVTHGLDTSLVPAVGTDISQTFGTILFNYAFITTVPSWANAKKPSVSIHKTVTWSVGVTTVMYLMVAILGGMAYHIPNNSSLIQAMNSAPDASVLSQITGYTFPIAALITSIPINIIVIRYNLIQSGACNMIWANTLSGALPWLVAIPCMTGSGLGTVINWSSLFLVSTANFIIPFILYIYSKKHRERLHKLPIIEMEQQARLSRELSRSSYSGHSRRGTSVTGSIRRRIHSITHTDLANTPPTGIAAATVLPVALGLGSGGAIRHSVSDDHMPGEMRSTGTHRRHHSHQNAAIGSSVLYEMHADQLNGPYFCYYKDGELYEQESVVEQPSHGTGTQSQASSVQRPSGLSTVVLHDPVTEMAQRKAALPRRVSHKDKLLSMISERHKRTLEEQEKRIREQQSEKPVPPMILLSQSTADMTADPDAETNEKTRSDSERPSYERNSVECESYSEKEASSGTENGAGPEQPWRKGMRSKKRFNRKSSVVQSQSPTPTPTPTPAPAPAPAPVPVPPQGPQHRSTLTLPPSSPPSRQGTPPGENRGSTDARTDIQGQESLPTLSPPRTPSSPRRFTSRRSHSVSPARVGLGSPGQSELDARSSMGVPANNAPRDSLKPETKHLSGSGRSGLNGSGTGPTPVGHTSPSPYSSQGHPSPSVSDSGGSIHSLERRVSFSDGPRLSVSPVELERKPSFSSETKRVVMAAVNSLTGNGSRFGSSTSLNSSKESKQAAREWKKTLLQSEEEGQRSEWQGEEDDDGEHDGLGPEVKHALGGSSSGGQGLFTDAMLQDHNPENRRDSMGRMAAAFVSQPGAFSIQTLPFRPEDMSSQEGETIPSDLLVKGVEKPVPLPYNPLFSPSAPMSVDLTHQPRNHTRTVSASAALQQRGNRAHHFAVRANSAHALQEQSTDQSHGRRAPRTRGATSVSSHALQGQSTDQSHGRRAPRTRGATSVSSHALALLSPSILLHSQALGPNPSSPSMIAEFQDLVSPLARSEPGSPQRSPIGKRASPTNRHYRRLTSSSRTLNAPFQSGNNYSIPGFSPSQPSFPATPMTTGHAQELPHTYQQLHHYQHHYQHQHQPSQHSQNQWSSWFNRKRHSRNPSRATMASCPPFSVPLGGVNPPSPLLEAIGESTSQLTTEHLQDFTKPIYEGTNTSSVDHSNNTTLIGTGTGTGGSEPSQGMVSEAISPYLYHRRHISSVASMNLCQERDRERDMHDRDPQEPWLPPVPPTATPSSPPPLPTPLTATGFQLPQYRTDTALALWGLRAIPSWIPLSSLKIAWSSLAILVLTIGGTIVYDFVQLGLGNDLVSGS